MEKSTETNTRFTIERNIIQALNAFQSNDGSRPAICGTHFECRSNSVIIIATCGRRLATYYHRASVLMPAGWDVVRFTADTTFALKSIPKAKRPWQVDLSDDGAEVRFAIGNDSAIIARNIQKSKPFPLWRGVVPTTPTAALDEFRFDSELMAPFVIAAQLLCNRKSSVRIVAHEGEGVNTSPFAIWIGNPDFYGLLMPMMPDVSTRTAPDWCLPPVVTVPVAAPVTPDAPPVTAPEKASSHTGETTQPPGAPVALPS